MWHRRFEANFVARIIHFKQKFNQTRTAMKNLNLPLIFSLCILAVFGSHPKTEAQMANPLETNPTVWNSREVMMIWGGFGSGNDVQVSQAVYGVDYVSYLKNNPHPFETRVSPENIPTSVLDPGVRPMAAQAADYNGDGRDEVIYAVSEADNIKITAPAMSVLYNDADSSFSIQLTPPDSYLEVYTGVDEEYTKGRGIPLLASGNFDGDGQEEFVLAARNSDGGIIVQLIDTDGGATPQLRAINDNETSVLDEWGTEVFDVCSGDFDGDGDDEIALVCLKPNTTGPGAYTVFLRIFDVVGTGCATLVEKAGQVIDDQTILPITDENNPLASVHVAVQSIKMNDSDPDKLLVAYAFTPTGEDSGNDQSNYYLELLDVAPDLGSFTMTYETDDQVNFQYFQSLGLRCGDMNSDGHDNPVVMVGIEFRVYGFNDDGFVLNAVSSEAEYMSDNDPYETDNFDVSDVDKNGRQNILYSHSKLNYPSYGDLTLYLKSVEFESDFSEGTIIESQVAQMEDVGVNQFYYGLAPGNFDGDDLRLGVAETFECTYRRPLFILAPPPTHFDHIDGENYDKSGCFTSGTCLFAASNTIDETNTSTLMLKNENDWNVSSTVSAGYEGVAVSVGTSMSAKYGEKFANENQQTQETNVTTHITATVDDMIKGEQYPVKVYEYPVYNAIGDVINYVSAAFPDYDEHQTYDQQGKLDPNYIPYYEPGNLLSYPPIGSVEDFDEYSPGSLIYEGDVYTMTNTPGSIANANISHSEIYGTSQSQSWNGGVALGLSASGFGIGFEASGEYNMSEMKINSTTMSGTDGFGIQYVNIQGPSGYFAYSVKPYIFWMKNGTGTLAYQVDLNSSESSPTWWDITYGQNPDPALMLPQYNEMYYTSGADPDSPMFTRSKSMTFNRLYPNVGDEVTVVCRVHNYSLKATSGPVKVSFYNGNPALGGELVESLDGQTVFETPEAIPPRDKSIVEMTFSMPLSVIPGEDFVRFYAMLDPQDEIEEVHEENNLGWQTLGYDCDNNSGTTSVQDYFSTDRFTEMWAWPNPTTGPINLAFNIAAGSDVFVVVRDMQGRQVMIKDLGNLPAGKQEVAFDLPSVSPGIYFVELNTKQFRKTRKIMVQ